MNHDGKSRVIGADGVGPCATETEDVAKFDKPAVNFKLKIKFQVTQIVRFLLERGLRFRNLGVCGHDLT
jgi:hypothetical protein